MSKYFKQIQEICCDFLNRFCLEKAPMFLSYKFFSRFDFWFIFELTSKSEVKANNALQYQKC